MRFSHWFYCILLFLIFSNSGIGQDYCGSDEVWAKNLPRNFLSSHRSNCGPDLDQDTSSILTLPVVVHIIHLGEEVGQGTNISDEQIWSAIQALNEDFRKIPGSNGDGSGVDTKIEFCLAQRDPNGNPSNGITRFNGSSLFWYDPSQNVNESYSSDGIAAVSAIHPGIEEEFLKETVGCWNPNDYINFYIVSEINGNNGGGGIQGFAYIYPTGNCRDGIVQLYNTFGTIGNIKPANLNRTTTHEAGHHLGLFHTFQSGGGCEEEESNCCTAGDQVCDTPPQPTPGQSCSVLVCPDVLPHNYMDYTPESCKNTFTQGQAQKMRHSLFNYRQGLLESEACQPLYETDLGILIQNFPEFWCRDVIDLEFNIINYGSSETQEFILRINGNEYEMPGIVPGSFSPILFEDYPFGSGEFEIEIILDGDEYLANNYYDLEIAAQNSRWLEITINTDFFAGETDWQLTDEWGTILLERGAIYPPGNSTYTYDLCLLSGCYEFTITDNFGDGMQFGGSYSLSLDQETIVSWGPGFYAGCNPSTGQGNPDQCWLSREHEFCVVVCDSVFCEGDFDQDGIVGVQDLLIILTRYLSPVQECDEIDLNGDEMINSEDLVLFIELYGLDCQTGNFIPGMGFPFELIGDLISGIGPQLNPEIFPIDRKIFDIYGKQVQESPELSRGIYLIREYYLNGDQRIRKVIVN